MPNFVTSDEELQRVIIYLRISIDVTCSESGPLLYLSV